MVIGNNRHTVWYNVSSEWRAGEENRDRGAPASVPAVLERAPGAWYATDGVVAIGPASFPQLQALVRCGRLTHGCLVRHEDWLAWQLLSEVEQLGGAERDALVRRLARASDRAPAADLTPTQRAPHALASTSASGTVARVSLRPAAVDPVGVLATALDLRSALLLLLSTSVAAASAQRALVYQVSSDERIATVVGVHGVAVETLLALAIDATDPGFRAAQRGSVVIADSEGGPIAQALAARFRLDQMPSHGVALVPLRVHGHLVAILELAQLCRPFRAREVARAEDVMDVFAERCVVMGWLD